MEHTDSVIDPHAPGLSRRKFIRGLGALGLLQLTPSALRASDFPTAAEARINAFPGATQFELKRFIAKADEYDAITAQLGGRKMSRIFTCHLARNDSGLLGYAVEGAVLGKHKNIDYLVALTPDLAVAHIEILAYRESYGYQIRNAAFRKQFYGVQPGAPLRLNQEITNIATATISCRSLIQAVREVLAYALVFLGNGVAAAAQCFPEGEILCRTRPAMGTLLTLKLRAQPQAEVAIAEAFAEVDRLEKQLSRFAADSEVSRINLSAGRGWQGVSSETYQLLERCESIRRASKNAFCVASHDSEPVPIRMFSPLKRVSLPEGANLDLGGVGKGYSLDCAATILRSHGIDRAILNFGGQILAIGEWEVIAGESGEPMSLCDESLATTNELQQSGHLRGTAARTSTTVRAPNAELADCWSTALHLMPQSMALHLASSNGLSLCLA